LEIENKQKIAKENSTKLFIFESLNILFIGTTIFRMIRSLKIKFAIF